MTACPPGLSVGTRRLVAGYIAYRIGRHGLPVPVELTTVGDDGDRPSKAASYEGRLDRALRDLGDEFQRRYSDVYSDMCDSVAVTPSNAESTFNAIVGQLFDGGTVNWGRIVALFSFSGALAAYCVKKDMIPVVAEFVGWTSGYIDNNLLQWISVNGGWDGLLDFHQNREDNQNGEWSWPCASSICGYLFSAVGMCIPKPSLVRRKRSILAETSKANELLGDILAAAAAIWPKHFDMLLLAFTFISAQLNRPSCNVSVLFHRLYVIFYVMFAIFGIVGL